jgi:very-short-patch-repair endonuclease
MTDLVSVSIHSRGKVTARLWGLAAVAGRQGGVVALWQLLDLGFTRSTVQHWLGDGRLHRVHAGVYAVGHGAIEWKGRLSAAVLACGREAALSHRSAAAWWELLPTQRAVVDVTAPGRHRRRGIDAHIGRLTDRDRTEHEDIPITTIPRTLLDLAEVESASRLAKAIDTAERRNLFDLCALNELLARSPGRRGLKRLRDLLSNYEPLQMTRSDLELEFLAFVEEQRLQRPQANALVGIHEVDMLWAEQRVIVELDTWDYHGTVQAFERDRARDIELKLLGYEVVRVTARRLRGDRARLASQLRRLLGLR